MSVVTVEVPRYLSPAEVCEMVPNLTERTLREMRARRRAGVRGLKAGPPFSTPSSRSIVYSADDVVAYLESIKAVSS